MHFSAAIPSIVTDCCLRAPSLIREWNPEPRDGRGSGMIQQPKHGNYDNALVERSRPCRADERSEAENEILTVLLLDVPMSGVESKRSQQLSSSMTRPNVPGRDRWWNSFFLSHLTLSSRGSRCTQSPPRRRRVLCRYYFGARIAGKRPLS